MAYETSKLTAVPYFYDKQLRRYIQQFIRIFAGFQVAMHSDAEGNTVYQTAPVRYGDVSRMAAQLTSLVALFKGTEAPCFWKTIIPCQNQTTSHHDTYT